MAEKSVQEIEKKVKELIAEKLNKDLSEISNNASFIDDLGADSLDVVQLVMDMEEEFGLDIPESDAEKIVTVQDAINYIVEHTL